MNDDCVLSIRSVRQVHDRQVNIDTTPPALTQPGTVTVDATDVTGATVPFPTPPTATDARDTPKLTISPSSSDKFGIGRSQVAVTAIDLAGDKSSGVFEVAVRGSAEQLDALADDMLQRLSSAWRQPADGPATDVAGGACSL